MDGSGAAGLWSRLRRGRGEGEWEQNLATEIDRITAGDPPEAKLLIPALQIELGRRLETAAGLMKDRGYRLHMVIPKDGMMWAAGFERADS